MSIKLRDHASGLPNPAEGVCSMDELPSQQNPVVQVQIRGSILRFDFSIYRIPLANRVALYPSPALSSQIAGARRSRLDELLGRRYGASDLNGQG